MLVQSLSPVRIHGLDSGPLHVRWLWSFMRRKYERFQVKRVQILRCV